MSKPKTATDLFEMLKPIQEAKGYYFNEDMDHYTMPLLESLLMNRETYGYMACPCRLPSGKFEEDRDIICPCAYRIPDVEEYGSCFCGRYVSQAWNEGTIPRQFVPERRPPELVK